MSSEGAGVYGLAAARVVTCDPRADGGASGLGVLHDGVVVIDGERIAYVGPRAGAPPGVAIDELGDCVVTPGLVDAHTHACWVGSRHAEYEARMRGGDYRAIARASGGILATHRAVLASSEDALVDALVDRLRRMASLGVTTVEVKSGYGLEASAERKQLIAIGRASARDDVPAVVPTLLALHALPPGTDRAAFVAGVARDLIPAVGAAGLARFVDAYVDVDAFTPGEVRVVALAAATAGLGIRLHVGQFADVGGAELAAELGAASADHLEHVSASGAGALARASVAAVLLPVASFTLGQALPPIAVLRAAGVSLVVASDANPGTAPTESLPLAMALAARTYGLSAEETILGATRRAAEALELGDRGILRAGMRADLVVWDLPHEYALLQPWGVSKARSVRAAGREIAHNRPR